MDTETKKYLEERFTKVDEQFASVRGDITRLESQMATKDDLVALESRLSKDISDVAESVGALATHMDERFNEITEKLDPLPHQVSNHDNRIKFLEDRLPKLAKA